MEDKTKEKEMPPWWKYTEDYFRKLHLSDLVHALPRASSEAELIEGSAAALANDLASLTERLTEVRVCEAPTTIVNSDA